MAIDVEHVLATGDGFPDSLIVFQAITQLLDVGDLDGLAQHHFAAVRGFLAGHQLEQRGLARTVAADDTDDGTLGNGEGQVVEQQLVLETLGDVVQLDDLVAQTRSRRNVDLVGLVALLEITGLHFLEAVETRLALGLTALGILANPLQLLLDGLVARGFLLGFLLQASVLLLQPRGIVAFEGNALATVELENPARDIVEEVTVVGDGDHGAGVIVQEALQPGDGLGVQVVGRLIQQQHVGAREQQAAEGDTAAFTTGQHADIGIPRRQAQRLAATSSLRSRLWASEAWIRSSSLA